MKIDKIQILGPFSSGTNLVAKMLKQNLNQDIQIHPEGHTLFWKHSVNKTLIHNFIKSNKNTLFVCLYKPINNWIYSMFNHSYNIKWNGISETCTFSPDIMEMIPFFQKNEYTQLFAAYNQDYSKFFTLKKYLIDKYSNDPKFPHVQKYSNIIEIYNKYYNMYIELINTYDRVIFMNYYDIIDNDNVVDYISQKICTFNLSLKNDNNIGSILNKPSKNHGFCVKSFDDAMKKKTMGNEYINNNLKNKSTIEKYFNYEIKNFFEKI